jgi:hypothetical protein
LEFQNRPQVCEKSNEKGFTGQTGSDIIGSPAIMALRPGKGDSSDGDKLWQIVE